MTFQDQTLNDAKDCLMNTDEFAEEVVYTPYGGSAKTVDAIVVREQIQKNEQALGQIGERVFELYILNDATLGVTSVKKGQDIVSLPVLIGGSSVNFSVVDIISKDDALWHLSIQR